MAKQKMVTMMILGLFLFMPSAHAVLQSGSPAPAEEEKPAASNHATMKLKFRPKPSVQAQPAAASTESSYVVEAPYIAESEPPATSEAKDDFYSEEGDPYQMRLSKNVHPASTKPEGTSPVIQTVNGPRTTNYGAARPASVLYPGHAQGSSGTGRVRSRSDMTSSSNY